MAYQVFQNKVNALINRAGGNTSVRFSSEDGRHIARCSDGTTIIGSASCLRVKVLWGSGHTALAHI